MKVFSVILFLLSILALPVLSAGTAAKETKAVITGDQMQMNKGGSIIIFSGNAKVVRGADSLKADTLTQDKSNNIVDADGNIDFRTFTKDQELLTATSGKAHYNVNQGVGQLWESRPHLVYYAKQSTGPVQGPVHMFADTIAFDQKEETIHGSGSVEILTSSASAYAPVADFSQNDKKVVFTGTPQPKLVFNQESQKGSYTADTITIYLDKKKAYLEGSVHGIMTIKDQPKSK